MTLRSLAFLICAAVALSGCRSAVDQRLERARALVFENKPKLAAAEYRALLALLDEADDGDARPAVRIEALSRLGDISYLDLHDTRAAAAAYRKLIARAPSADEAWAARQKLADISERYFHDLPAAIAQWQALAASGRPGADRFSYLAAKAYFEEGQYEQCRTECADLAARSPNGEKTGDALFLLATAWQFEGKYEEAIAAFEDVEHRWPGTPLAARARFQIGRSEVELDELDAAMNSFLAALQKHPEPKRVQAQISRVRRLRTEQPRIARGPKTAARG